jgi:hypothetical protein
MCIQDPAKLVIKCLRKRVLRTEKRPFLRGLAECGVGGDGSPKWAAQSAIAIHHFHEVKVISMLPMGSSLCAIESGIM